MRSSSALLVCFALLAGVAQEARAENAPPVAIAVDPCVDVEPSALDRLVAIELGTSIGSDENAATRVALTRVEIGCVEADTEIRLDDAITRKTLTRRVALARVDAGARTRLLALTVAELVVASWIELSLDPPPLTPSGPPPPPEARASARATARERAALAEPTRPRDATDRTEWELGVMLGPRVWTGEPTPLLGAGVDLVHRAAEHWGWTLSVGFERGLGRVEVREGSIALSALDLLAAAIAHTRLDRVELAAGAGMFLAWCALEGLPDPDAGVLGHDTRLVAAGPALLVRASLRLGDRVGLVLHASGGPVTLPARALSDAPTGDRSVVALEGARLAGGLGLSIAL